VSTWPGVLSTLLAGGSLSRDDAAWAMAQVMDGEATSAQVAGFAIALRAKGETSDELSGLVATMLDRARPVTVSARAVDTCGTGGDRSHTVNISTMAALAVAGAGIPVVKHGNRAASSSCGSADLLEALGVAIDLEPDAVGRCVDETGIGFCFAAIFHPALRHAAAPRRELGVATVFNFLGPLTNPARPTSQAVGVADPRMAGVMAGVLADRGSSALVFRGDDGLDELTTSTTSRVWLVRDGAVIETSLDPTALGIAAPPPDALRGGDAATNAAVARRFLAAEPGPVRDAVLLNAAAALVAYDGGVADVDALPEALAAGISRAAEAVDSGAAAAALERWVAFSQAQRAR
jgi:anthranilate phosphoribosyltransferase